MIRVFVDANILLSVLNKEYPLFTYASRIMSLAGSKKFQLFTSPLCLAIAFYFSEKKYNSKIAKQKISLLCDHIRIANATSTSVKKALANETIKDFEDGLEYYSAEENNCICILTEDIHDFDFSKIEVINSENFFLKYMKK
ncbi:MAG: PIN domain-containing protein [Ginsengibacter sp.]